MLPRIVDCCATRQWHSMFMVVPRLSRLSCADGDIASVTGVLLSVVLRSRVPLIWSPPLHEFIPETPLLHQGAAISLAAAAQALLSPIVSTFALTEPVKNSQYGLL